MLLEMFRALLLAGLPVGLLSFGLVGWSLRRGRLGEVGSFGDVEREIKRLGKEHKAERKQRNAAKRRVDGLLEGFSIPPRGDRLDPVHRKWLAFGGGFYGVVALMTYVVIELLELRDFFLGFEGFADMFHHLGLGTLIGLLVEAALNFVAALAWPVYWLAEISTGYPWLWFIAAWLGYWAGVRLALYRASKGIE